jgi:hypothetical protein
MKTIELTDDEIKFLIYLIQDKKESADILRLESKYVIKHIHCGNISKDIQKKITKEAEETIDRCNNLLKKFEV